MIKVLKEKSTELKLFAPKAKKVSLAGNFNGWDTKSLTAKKDAKGNWTVKLDLKPGQYEYKFMVDGSWLTDPHCSSYTNNSFGTQNCLLEVK
ncbi:MAG: isoamylase early set domain-containing protein [Candidatus Omnitrophota bacterium]